MFATLKLRDMDDREAETIFRSPDAAQATSGLSASCLTVMN